MKLRLYDIVFETDPVSFRLREEIEIESFTYFDGNIWVVSNGETIRGKLCPHLMYTKLGDNENFEKFEVIP